MRRRKMTPLVRTTAIQRKREQIIRDSVAEGLDDDAILETLYQMHWLSNGLSYNQQRELIDRERIRQAR